MKFWVIFKHYWWSTRGFIALRKPRHVLLFCVGSMAIMQIVDSCDRVIMLDGINTKETMKRLLDRPITTRRL
jgi:hypothetical protein